MRYLSIHTLRSQKPQKSTENWRIFDNADINCKTEFYRNCIKCRWRNRGCSNWEMHYRNVRLCTGCNFENLLTVTFLSESICQNIVRKKFIKLRFYKLHNSSANLEKTIQRRKFYWLIKTCFQCAIIIKIAVIVTVIIIIIIRMIISTIATAATVRIIVLIPLSTMTFLKIARKDFNW